MLLWFDCLNLETTPGSKYLTGNNLLFLLRHNSLSDTWRITTHPLYLFTRDPLFTQYLDVKSSGEIKKSHNFRAIKPVSSTDKLSCSSSASLVPFKNLSWVKEFEEQLPVEKSTYPTVLYQEPDTRFQGNAGAVSCKWLGHALSEDWCH